MAITDHKIPIYPNVNDIPSTVGNANHPNGSYFTAKYNAALDEITTAIAAGAGAGPSVDPYANVFKQSTATTITIPTIYVSLSGNDTNNGLTDTTPVLTISRAIEIIADTLQTSNDVIAMVSITSIDGFTTTDELIDLRPINSVFNNWSWRDHEFIIQFSGITFIHTKAEYTLLLKNDVRVFFNNCTFELTDVLAFHNYSNLYFQSGTVNIKSTYATGNEGLTFSQCRNIVIEGISIIVETGANPWEILSFFNSQQCTVDVYINANGVYYGMGIHGNSQVLINDITVDNANTWVECWESTLVCKTNQIYVDANYTRLESDSGSLIYLSRVSLAHTWGADGIVTEDGGFFGRNGLFLHAMWGTAIMKAYNWENVLLTAVSEDFGVSYVPHRGEVRVTPDGCVLYSQNNQTGETVLFTIGGEAGAGLSLDLWTTSPTLPARFRTPVQVTELRDANGVKVVSAQQAAIADATAGTEITTINAILAAMRAHGLIAT